MRSAHAWLCATENLLQLRRIAGELHSFFIGDLLRLIQLLQRLVHSIHAEVLSVTYRGVELAGIAVLDLLANGRRIGQYLDGRDTPDAGRAMHQPLRGDAEQGSRQLRGDLPVQVLREAVDNAVDSRR